MIIGFLSKLPSNGTSWRRPLCSTCIHVLIPWTSLDLFHGWSMNRYVQHIRNWKDSGILRHCFTFSEILCKIFFYGTRKSDGHGTHTHTWCRTEKHAWIWLEITKEWERRPRHRCENNIKNDLQEMGWEGVDWIHLFLENMVMNSQVL